MPVISQIPNQYGINWNFLVATGVHYDAINYITDVVVTLHESPEAFTLNKGNFAPVKHMGFRLSLDPNYPFQTIKKQKPNLTIVAQHSNPQSANEITQAELDGLRGNFDGYIMTQPEVDQLLEGDTVALLDTYIVRYLQDNFGIDPNSVMVV